MNANDLNERIRLANQQQNVAHQAQAARQAKVESFILMTGSNIYGHLAAAEIATTDDALSEGMDADKMRALADKSKAAALFLAEAYGMVQVKTEVREGE